jgi:hypothetical protein
MWAVEAAGAVDAPHGRRAHKLLGRRPTAAGAPQLPQPAPAGYLSDRQGGSVLLSLGGQFLLSPDIGLLVALEAVDLGHADRTPEGIRVRFPPGSPYISHSLEQAPVVEVGRVLRADMLGALGAVRSRILRSALRRRHPGEQPVEARRRRKRVALAVPARGED